VPADLEEESGAWEFRRCFTGYRYGPYLPVQEALPAAVAVSLSTDHHLGQYQWQGHRHLMDCYIGFFDNMAPNK
jgi:hypothetical protein